MQDRDSKEANMILGVILSFEAMHRAINAGVLLRFDESWMRYLIH